VIVGPLAAFRHERVENGGFCLSQIATRGRVSATSFSFEISALATASFTVALIVQE
jgi:hypothetical protein